MEVLLVILSYIAYSNKQLIFMGVGSGGKGTVAPSGF